MSRFEGVALAALCAACGGGRAAEATHRITGTVSGSASAGVAVSLSGAATGSTTTDAGGRYAFADLGDGDYLVTPALSGHAFAPGLRFAALRGADVAGLDFAATVVPPLRLSGWVEGVVWSGVTVHLLGTATATTTTDASGNFAFDGVPDGAYTVAPDAPAWSFIPPRIAFATGGQNVPGLAFTATPPSSPFTVTIGGDAASGVATATCPGANAGPNPDVAEYESTNDAWTIGLRYDAGGYQGMGGYVTFHGTPQLASYTERTPGMVNPFVDCWDVMAAAGGNTDKSWAASSFTLTLTSVGTGVPTNLRGQGSTFLTYYPVHGTFHAVCSPDSRTNASGTVTVDVNF